MKGASKVDTAVKVNDNARFAPEIYAMTLDAKPLGEQPTKIIPAAISGGNPDVVAKPNPTIGIMVN